MSRKLRTFFENSFGNSIYHLKFLTILTCHFRDEQKLVQKQLAYVLGRLQIFLELDEESEDVEDLAEIISNSHLNNSFLALAREVYFLLLDNIFLFKIKNRLPLEKMNKI